MESIQVSELKIIDKPIFVLGAPRSGTSMMQWALRQHPELWGGQESDFMIPLAHELRRIHEFGSQRGRLHWLSGQNVGEAEFLRYIGTGLNALYTSRSRGLRWVEQTPQYTLHMNDILALFPGAVFVMMLRDGRDVVESLKNFVNPVPHGEAAALWGRFASEGLDFADGPNGHRLHTVRYADAVLDTESTLQRLFNFLEIEPSVKSAEWIADRSPINSSFDDASEQSSIGRWEEWSRELRHQFHHEAGEVLIRAGFEIDESWV